MNQSRNTKNKTQANCDKLFSPTASTRFRGTILLVDDDRSSIEPLSRWFDGQGYDTKPTFHPLHGLTMAAEKRIDAAIIDIDLPDMNGLAFLQELLRLGTFPVIVHASEVNSDVFRKAKELGAYDCLAKPASAKDLQASIEQALFHRR